MSTKLLVFAHSREAAPTIAALQALPVPGKTQEVWLEGRVPSLYTFSEGWIVISNSGTHAAQMAVSLYAPPVDEVWNLGLAGALDTRMKMGQIYEIETVGKAIFHPSRPQDFPIGKGKRLISSDVPIHNTCDKAALGEEWDLVDMEGYGVAFAAHHLGKKCRMWKIVSDFASPGGSALIQKNIDQLAEKIYEIIHESCANP